jgi:hypothetical protein
MIVGSEPMPEAETVPRSCRPEEPVCDPLYGSLS